MAAGGLFVAPTLVLSEVAGAIVRRTGDATFTQRVIQSLLNLPNLRLVPLDRQLGQLSAYLAIRLRLRGADAVYVATAQRLNLRHITWDDEQRTGTGGVIVARTP
jgi:predicted nucleic acid-binding protein